MQTRGGRGIAPELKARVRIDTLLGAAGWYACNVAEVNIHASVGVVTFSAPSTAAAVVLGRGANGRTEWKGADGRTLKEIQEAEAAQ